jgi:cysteine dioxygenase
MELISIDDFVSTLCGISEDRFSLGVYDFLKQHCVENTTLKPYLFFSLKHYTRNLIFRNELFELMAICWEVGQASRIHNHWGQNCWMAVPIGKLRVQNFSVVDEDRASGFCRLDRAEAFDIHRRSPAEVDPAEPVHQVLNLPQFNERAVSLHIYSRPYDRCLVYSPAKDSFEEVTLEYTSERGKLCRGVEL